MTFTIKRRMKEKIDRKEEKKKPKTESKTKTTPEPPKVEHAIPLSNDSVNSPKGLSSTISFQHQYKNEILQTVCPSVLMGNDLIIDQAKCKSKSIGKIELESESEAEADSKKAEKLPEDALDSDDVETIKPPSKVKGDSTNGDKSN